MILWARNRKRQRRGIHKDKSIATWKISTTGKKGSKTVIGWLRHSTSKSARKKSLMSCTSRVSEMSRHWSQLSYPACVKRSTHSGATNLLEDLKTPTVLTISPRFFSSCVETITWLLLNEPSQQSKPCACQDSGSCFPGGGKRTHMTIIIRRSLSSSMVSLTTSLLH